MTRATSKRISMNDIAKAAGVSAMTISRALKGDIKQVRPSAIEQTLRIRQLAEDLGYRKSAAPQAMLSGKFNAITLLGSTNWRQNQLSPVRMIGLQEEAAQHHLSLIVAQIADSELTNPTSLPSMLQDMSSDGLLINYMTGYPQEFDDLLHRYNIPAIWMNSKHSSDCIHPDDFGGSKLAVDHLVKLGHKRIGFFGFAENDTEHYSVVDRRNGYFDIMAKHTYPALKMLFPHALPYQDYASFLQPWLARSDRPTAIIAYGMPQAVAVITAAAKQNLSIPEDLSLITFHDEIDIYQITTIHIPEKELGRQAIRLLQQKIAAPKQALGPVSLPMTLELKDTTCAPAKRRK